jgi:hypothetical protein
MGLLDGSHTADEISKFMRTVPNYTGPISITSATFQAALNDTKSAVNQRLQAHDAYNRWKPASSMKLQMFHNTNDDLVPKGNTDNAAAAWKGLPNVQAAYYLELLPGVGSVHTGVLPLAYINGTAWLNSIAWPKRGSVWQ